MGNQITQYRPAFFDGFETEKVEFETVEELLNIPFVKNFSDYPDFYRFSIGGDGNILIAEYHNGVEWLVVGMLKSDLVDMPRWEHPTIKRKSDHGDVIMEGV